MFEPPVTPPFPIPIRAFYSRSSSLQGITYDPPLPSSAWVGSADSDRRALGSARGQQVAESHVVGQLQQRHEVLGGRPDPGPPSPYRVKGLVPIR